MIYDTPLYKKKDLAKMATTDDSRKNGFQVNQNNAPSRDAKSLGDKRIEMIAQKEVSDVSRNTKHFLAHIIFEIHSC